MTYIALLLSVLIGIIIVFGLKPNNKTIQLLLSFSGAYLLSITILHLLPEVYHSTAENIEIYILFGLLLQLILDYFSKGAEHGHIHAQINKTFPFALFISLCLHAFMEGIPLGHSHDHEHLLWAVVVHKVPIAIILGTFFIKSNFSKMNTIIYLFIFALMSPIGNFAGEHISLLITYKAQITAIIIGIFLHISTIILFESSKDHKFNRVKFAAILLGMVVALLV